MKIVKKSRCPACNPIHSGGPMGQAKANQKKAKCVLCKGVKMIKVDMACRYVQTLYGTKTTFEGSIEDD